MTPDKNLAGYCGLYCGGCDILRLYRDSQAAARTPTWDELPERMRKHLPFKPTTIVCHGCRSDTVFAGCAYCPMRSCAMKKSHVEFCVDCESYPCLRTRMFEVIAWVFSFKKKLPHQQTKQPNLDRLRQVGCAAWLAEQEQQWRCPDCGTPYSWYRSTCVQCGKELDSLKGYL